MKTHAEFLAEWRDWLRSAKRQLGYFESGKMRWKVNGVDRSDQHIATLRRVIESIEKMLEPYGDEKLPENTAA